MPIPTLTEGSMDRQTKRTSTAPKLVLEPVRESSRLDSHPLAAGRYLIGSSPECDIVIAMGGVAAQHCLMIVGANKTIVKAISPLTSRRPLRHWTSRRPRPTSDHLPRTDPRQQ